MLKFNSLTSNTDLIGDLRLFGGFNAGNTNESKLKGFMKNVYDFGKKYDIDVSNFETLPKLLVNNFESEQIWQQIDAQTRNVVEELSKNDPIGVENEIVADAEQLDGEEISENDEDSVGDDLEEESDEVGVEKHVPDDDGDDSYDGENLSEMDEDHEKRSLEEDDSDELMDDEEDDDDGTTNNNLYYNDFFGTENSDEDKEEKKIEKSGKKTVRFLCDSNDNDKTSANENDTTEKSAFELREERLKKKIADLETNVLDEKPWQLKGEVTADCRPVDSLLTDVVSFDTVSRPAPVIAEKTSLTLESIIKQRIIDESWDSVERKAPPKTTKVEFKTRLVLNQEKSKESLAQIYERDFLKQKKLLDNPDEVDSEPLESPEQIELKKSLKSVLEKLDILASFHFTPKAVNVETKIVKNLPALVMEEVTPITLSSASQMAPEEVFKKPKSGQLVGKSEVTVTDKNRLKRKRKIKQKFIGKKKLEREAAIQAKIEAKTAAKLADKSDC